MTRLQEANAWHIADCVWNDCLSYCVGKEEEEKYDRGEMGLLVG